MAWVMGLWPSKQHVPFCHCTVWFRSIEL